MGTIRHNFTCVIPDDPASVTAGEVVPSNWNADHDIDLTTADVPDSLNKRYVTDADLVAIGNIGNSPVFTEIEKNLGSVPRLAGKFTITGFSGLTIGKPVNIFQAAAPYTGKGTLADEAEMDGITVKAVVTAADTITAYWNAMTRVKGNIKFNYLVGG